MAQFEVAAAPNLGLNALTPAGQVLLDQEGNRICSDIRSSFTPDQIVQDIESGLRAGDDPVTDQGASAAIADAVLYVCPDEKATFDQVSGA
jgi:hypothetical protein